MTIPLAATRCPNCTSELRGDAVPSLGAPTGATPARA
jgi:hypothetical protein